MADPTELPPHLAEAQGDADDEGGEESSAFGLNVTVEEKVDIARQVTHRMFELLGVQMPGIEVLVEDEQVVVRLTDVDPGLTQAGDTRVLESLQFILNKAINRFSLRRTRLSIDAEGFRRRRPEGLDKVAQALAQKVVRLGKAIAVGPMGQGDLRFLTAQLSRNAGVTVQPVGAPDKRRLIIAPVRAVEPVPAAAVAAAPAEAGEPGEGGEREGRRRRRRRR